MKKLSVIVPAYKEEANIKLFIDRLIRAIEKITNDYEVIFSVDPSKDKTENLIMDEIKKNSKIRMIVFSRRFGQPNATMAGLKLSKAERSLIIDCDLQDPPELIDKMFTEMDKGFDVVLAVRKSRKGETLIKKIITNYGYKLINKITDIKIPANSGDFRMLSKKVVDELKLIDEPNAFLRGLVAYIGFRQTSLIYDSDERSLGKSKYNKYFGSIKIAFNGIFGFSSKPIFLMSLIGFIFAIMSFLIGFYYIIVKILDPTITPGLSSTILIITFFSGLQLIGLGILGEYIGRIHDDVKKRPKYIIDKKINFDD